MIKEEIQPVMSDQILLRFLGAGLIDVGGDDAKLAKLRETASDLAAALKKAPSKTSSFALIAFDPASPEEDPVITEVCDALQKRWPTYINTFSGTPMMVLRALLLDALVQAASDEKVGVAFVTSARNALPFIEAGNEQKIWVEAVLEIESRVDARAETEWATPDSIDAPELKYSAPPAVKISSQALTIDTESLTATLQAAAGPNGAGPNKNRFWPHGDPQNWATDFGRLAANAIAGAIDAASEDVQSAPVDISGPLRALSVAVATHVGDTLRLVSAATAGLQRRTNLIWWKETLYSPSARVSYRALPVSTVGALMALDLHQQVPTFSPVSVAEFLSETVLSLASVDPAKKQSIRELVCEAVESAELSPLRAVARQLVPQLSGRGPILGLLAEQQGKFAIDDAQFRARVGVPADAVLTIPEWAAWIFRELQAARATQEVVKAKKPGSKA
ncbi:GTPase-associated system all-helical protein GASH [Pseudomonas sp. Os17]|uniref:GTPase-associated system all-helical protein GASH n=1 Tax=Pseudomonas sp. Os17 TaxID=1500686 RepID=UPI0018D49B93|nr:GTPase-associated system all-helical protein GASH [Pseudomonas sp. Os17]